MLECQRTQDSVKWWAFVVVHNGREFFKTADYLPTA
jgi:hypothetical protein